MVVGNVPEAADFVVVGAGPGGYAAALRAAAQGRKVVLIDSAGVRGAGGVCLHTGCIPSKTLIEAAHLHHSASHGSLGVSAEQVQFDTPAFQAQKLQIVDELSGGVRGLLEHAGVEFVHGSVALTEPDTCVVNLDDGNILFLTFEALVLATGSSPAELPDLPFDGERILDSTGVLALQSLPSTLAVVGAGYVGLELGTALAKLGVRVTILDVESRVLPQMDPLIAKVVQGRLQALGINFHAGARARGWEQGQLCAEADEGGLIRIDAEQVLVAVGRRANAHGLGLSELGIDVNDNGCLDVAENCLLTERIAAIGDLTAGPALAHKAMAQARVAVDALLGKPAGFDAVVPEIVFCDPEVACAGLTLEAAHEHGLEASTFRFPLAASGRAVTLGVPEGFCQLVVDADGLILGVQMVGAQASERIAEAVVAIEFGASAEDLALCIHPHPTLSESLNEAAQLAAGIPLHIGR
ncbi:MAG: dihydrolipoyl dehydrogenase [Thiotrichales bacterium]|nr:dihydrolipoyl dehydrogenase [Thiotrichales bacterium]